jgi:hypothetical protein
MTPNPADPDTPEPTVKVNGVTYYIYWYQHAGESFIFLSKDDGSGAHVTISRNGIVAKCSFFGAISDAFEQACMTWTSNRGFAGLDLISFLKGVGAVNEYGEAV